MKILHYRIFKNVDRLALQNIHREYNLMEHQYGVTTLFMKFAELEGVIYDLKVIDILLHHDAIEAVSMDLPYPVKNFNKVTKKAWEVIEEELIKGNPELEKYSSKNIKKVLNTQQYGLFKAMDYLELYIFVCEEIALGNKTKGISEVYVNCVRLIGEICDKHGFGKVRECMYNYEG